MNLPELKLSRCWAQRERHTDTRGALMTVALEPYRLELIPLTGEMVLHFELSRASTPGTDTSMVRFPSSKI